jgi:hypothetical protein
MFGIMQHPDAINTGKLPSSSFSMPATATSGAGATTTTLMDYTQVDYGYK